MRPPLPFYLNVGIDVVAVALLLICYEPIVAATIFALCFSAFFQGMAWEAWTSFRKERSL